MLAFFLALLMLDSDTSKLTIPVDKKETYIDNLEFCESSSRPDVIREDDGGSRSVGILQFKDKTFMHFSKYYKLNYTSEDIYDPVKQRNLARLMLKDGRQNHWYNCSKKLGAF